MRFRLTAGWSLGDAVAPANTIVDFAKSDRWSKLAKGKLIPFNATPLDDEAWQAQLAAYPEHRHLLGGGWQPATSQPNQRRSNDNVAYTRRRT
jgi:hypothetical protein